jgi:putative ABC transport system ATP-binding protein
MTPSRSGALEVRELRLSYPLAGGGRVTALEVDSLSIGPGETVGFMGPSGAGKTSLLYALTGIERPDTGSVLWGDVDISTFKESERDRWRRHNVGFIFQDFHLISGMSALQNVLVPATFDGAANSRALHKRAEELLERVGAPEGRYTVDLLSRGEQQRVAVARSLIMAPAIICADEPIASLDEENAVGVMDLLFEIAEETGSTLLAVTHDSIFIDRLDTVHHMILGKIHDGADEADAELASGGMP